MTERSPDPKDQCERVLEFINTKGEVLVRHMVLGSEEADFQARTVFAIFPNGKERHFLFFSYQEGEVMVDDETMISRLPSRINNESIDDKPLREYLERKTELDNFPIAVLLIGEQDLVDNVCLLTFEGLDPNKLYGELHTVCRKRTEQRKLAISRLN